MVWYNQQIWTEQEKQILKLNYAKVPMNELMYLLPNRSISGIKSRASKLNIKKDGIYYGGWNKNFNLNLSLTYGTRQDVLITLEKKDKESPWYSKRQHKINDYFFEKPTMENCYWAGFIAADGTINPNGVCLALQLSDGIHLEKFKEAIGWSGEIDYKIKTNKARIYVSGVPLWLYDLDTIFNIKPFKSFTLEPPNLIEKEHILSYIVGYIDGDGSIFINKNNWGYYLCLQISGTKKILEWMYPYLLMLVPIFNKHKKARVHRSNGYPSLSFNGKRALYIINHLNNFYKGYKLERKWNKVNEYSELKVDKKIII